MQKFSACKNRSSLTQRRFSTSSVCMIAICPAGPPKLMTPSLNQNRAASARVGMVLIAMDLAKQNDSRALDKEI